MNDLFKKRMLKRATEWSMSVNLRILVGQKRKLQQRWTRCLEYDNGDTQIEERWDDVPEVVE